MMIASIGSTIGSADAVRTSLLTAHGEAQGSAEAEYRSDLVPPESVARFGRCLVGVAEQVVRNPEIRMSDLTVG